jgi:pilus assembly protein CpaB
MKVTRTMVVAIAVVLGAAAAGLSYYFLNNAQNKAYNNAKLASAYVVTKQVPQGLTGSDAVSGNYFEQKQIPTEVRPTTAITNLDELNGKLAISNYPPGQVLVSGMFVSPSQAVTTFSQSIPAGDVAVTVSVDQVHGVANLPAPGDKVDMLVSANGSTTFLLQNVPILAIGQNTGVPTSSAQTAGTTTASSSTTTPANTSGLFTFAATPTNAARIAFAEQNNLGIYLLLVPNGNPVVSVPGINAQNLLSGPPS